MGKERGGGRIEAEKEVCVCGSATPKVVSAWSFDGGGGATTPLMLSHPLSRRFSISICIYIYTFLLSFSSPFLSLCRFSLTSFLRSRGEGGIVLAEGSTFHVRRPLCTFL